MKTHENNANPKDIRFRSTLFRRKNDAIRGRSTVWSLEAPVLRRSLRRRGRRVVASSRASWLRSPPNVLDSRASAYKNILDKKRCIKEKANK